MGKAKTGTRGVLGKTAAKTAPTAGATNANGGAKAAPRSVAIAAKGVRTGEDFANLMSALMSDVIEGRVAPDVANASVNAGGKLLKVVEMQYRYGRDPKLPERMLTLAPGA